MPKLELRSEWTTHPAPRSPIASNFQFHKYEPTKNAKMNNGYCDTKQEKAGDKNEQYNSRANKHCTLLHHTLHSIWKRNTAYGLFKTRTLGVSAFLGRKADRCVLPLSHSVAQS